MVKLVPPAGSISIFKNLGLFFQLIAEKSPIDELAFASPITTLNNPWAFVVTFRVSVYSTVPVELPCNMLSLRFTC